MHLDDLLGLADHRRGQPDIPGQCALLLTAWRRGTTRGPRAAPVDSEMDIAHQFFHQDSRHILTYLVSDHADASHGAHDKRRELSILLCSILMRRAGQDWYEQGDIWARVSEHRSLPPDVSTDRLQSMETGLRRLMTVDAAGLVRDNGALALIADWADAFDRAGMALGDLARTGVLHRGLRAVLAHHVIFAWNRLGLSHTAQSLLAHVGRTVVFGEQPAGVTTC